MDASLLNGQRVTSARVFLPAWGVWYADVAIDGAVTLPGGPLAATLKINDLSLIGTILSGGPSIGRSDYRVIGGAGGWGKIIPPKSYANDAGVKLATVLNDAATAAGETIDPTTIPTTTVGPAYTRPADPACRTLERYAASAWYVREDGVTRLGARTPGVLPAGVSFTSPIDLSRGKIELASESIASILPGLVAGGLTAVDVVHELGTTGGLRTTLYGALSASGTASTDDAGRRLASLRLILDQLDPNRKFRAAWEYRVVTLEGNRANLQAVLVSSGMPDLRRVFIRPSLAGSKSSLKLGARVVVTFVNGDPARPIVISEEDADGAGFLPSTTSIDATTSVAVGPSASAVILAGGGQPVARANNPLNPLIVGDSVNAGYLVFATSSPLALASPPYYPGTPVGLIAANAAVAAGAPNAFMVSLTSGSITSGSSKVGTA